MKRAHLFRWTTLTINMFAALLLLMSQLAAVVPPSRIALFSVLALIYPILVAVNLLFMSLWIIVKRKYWLISFITIVIGLNTFFNNFQFHFTKQIPDEEKQINVISYNVRLFSADKKGKDSEVMKENIIGYLTSQRANIICLQEYHSMDKNVYSPLIKLTKSLDQQTYYYESYYNPRYDQLSGLVIFSTYEAIDKGKLKFPGSRTFGIYTDLVVGQDTIRVYNVHLASIRLQESDIGFVLNPDFNDHEFKEHSASIYTKLTSAFMLREHQVSYITEEIRNCSYPVMICGDLNDTPSSYTHGRIGTNLKDAFVEKGRLLGKTYAGRIPFLRIDYIFASDEFNIAKYDRYRIYYSDHFPVHAVLHKKTK